MRIISERQLYIDGTTRRAGEPFDADADQARELIGRGVVRVYEAPQKVYETKPKRFEQPTKRPRSSGAPLVTCLCPTTAKRASWLHHAIRYFQLQTYANRELLIVAEDTERAILDVIPDDPRIRVVLYRAFQRIPLGAKRNFVCSLAESEILAQWDDDDYSAPGRLADQVPRLIASAMAATAYTKMKFTDGVRWWEATLAPINSSLVFRKSWWEQHRFPEIQVASDIPFLNALVDAGEITAGPSRDLMAASVHVDNTSPRSLSKSYGPIPVSWAIPEFRVPSCEAEAVAC